jgi:hypothetical protein
LVCGLLELLNPIFCIIVWLGWFSMTLGFVVVCNIIGIEGRVGHGIVLAYFLVWSWGYCLALGLCCYLDI